MNRFYPNTLCLDIGKSKGLQWVFSVPAQYYVWIRTILMHKTGQSCRGKVFVILMCNLYMASKTISNKSALIGLFGLFIGQGFLIGLVLTVLGLTKTIDPFVSFCFC